LRRDLGTLDLFALGYSDVSSTYYFTFGVIALYSGYYLPLMMLFGSLSLWVVGLVYAEFGSAIPRTGGAYYYVKRELGGFLGFIAGWLLCFDQILMISYGSLGTVGYLSIIIPILSQWPFNALVSLAIIWCVAILNIVGIKWAARFNIPLLIIDLIGVFTLITVGYLFTPLQVPSNLGPGVISAIGGLSYALRGYTGIDVIAQSAGETRNPSRSVPISIFLISAMSTLVALLISLLIVLTGSVEVVARNLDNPIGALASSLKYGEIIAPPISIAIVLVLLVAVNSGMVDFSRGIYIMSEEGSLPRNLSRIHARYRTPYLSILASSIVASIFVIPGSVELIAGSYAIGSMITYLLASIALMVFRNKERELVKSITTPSIRLSEFEVPLVSVAGLVVYSLAIILALITRPEYMIPIVSWLIIGLVISRYPRGSAGH